MENRILKRKLTFVHHLFNLPKDSLASQVALLQDRFSLPWLISEMKEVIKALELPDMKKVSKIQWRNIVNKMIKEKNKKRLG